MSRRTGTANLLCICAVTLTAAALPAWAGPPATPPAATAPAPTAARPLPPLVPAKASDVLAAIREPGAKAVLVNFWATWCVPCVKELPDILKVRQEYAARGLRVVLVSADVTSEVEAARKLLASRGVDFKTFLKAEKDDAFITAFDARWSGTLPATFLYDGKGRPRDFWEGQASYEKFATRIQTILGGSTR